MTYLKNGRLVDAAGRFGCSGYWSRYQPSASPAVTWPTSLYPSTSPSLRLAAPFLSQLEAVVDEADHAHPERRRDGDVAGTGAQS